MSHSCEMPQPITGVILAGGQGRRLGNQDKGLMMLGGQPLIEHAIAILQPQTDALIISANRHLPRYQRYHIPVVQDESSNDCGPLAGIAAAMRITQTPYLLTAPCDCPFIPPNLVRRLWHRLQTCNADICLAADRHRTQPLIALISTALKNDLTRAIAAGVYKAHTWMTTQRHCLELFDQEEVFLNINTPQDLANAQEQLHLNRRQPLSRTAKLSDN